MAYETGTILTVTSSSTGSITRDNGASPNPCSYDSYSGPALTPGDRVGYDIDLDAIITNIVILPPSTSSGDKLGNKRGFQEE